MSVSLTARKPGSRYSIMEEIANAATHGLGALLAVAGTVLLLLKTTGDPWKVVSASIYGSQYDYSVHHVLPIPGPGQSQGQGGTADL